MSGLFFLRRPYVRLFTAADGTMSLAQFGLLAVATSNLLPDGAAQLANLPPSLAEVL